MNDYKRNLEKDLPFAREKSGWKICFPKEEKAKRKEEK